ncbi:hypothetical protein HRQ91_10350 [Treponema parvum]|uniref:Uncharacterized protein n=1 Tax=Treponema parvum TaxID=138851 RepID=A0A975F5H7_9SPIR|nr:hypothetical protein [Treponema parvum]QTQ14831.1 hypothetical protein HRQ91_10350 [Treponema parvum]
MQGKVSPTPKLNRGICTASFLRCPILYRDWKFVNTDMGGWYGLMQGYAGGTEIGKKITLAARAAPYKEFDIEVC